MDEDDKKICDTAIHEVEKQAMIGNKAAVLQIVSLERKYRARCDRLVLQRHNDGAVDGCDMTGFLSDIESYLSEFKSEED